MTLEEQIILHEGLRLKAHRHPNGRLTIGAGRNLEEVGITQAEARYLLANDITRCREKLSKVLYYWRSLSDMRQRVLIDLCINLGLMGLLKCEKMLAALGKGDYDAAAETIFDSLFAVQYKERARWLAIVLRNDREPTAKDLAKTSERKAQ